MLQSMLLKMFRVLVLKELGAVDRFLDSFVFLAAWLTFFDNLSATFQTKVAAMCRSCRSKGGEVR